MELTSYSIEDLEFLLIAVRKSKSSARSDEWISLVNWELDIEQAIKDKEFEDTQTTLPKI